MKLDWILHNKDKGLRSYISKLNEDTAVFKLKTWDYQWFNYDKNKPGGKVISIRYLVFKLIKANGKIGLISSNYTNDFCKAELDLDFWPYVSQIESIYKVFPEIKDNLIYPDKEVRVFHNPVKDLIKEQSND